MAMNKYVHMPTLEEYSERFRDFFQFKRENGILEVKMHTNGGPVYWSYQMHHALSELWTTVGHDTNNEVLIFTSTDPYWIYHADSDSFREVEESPDNDQRFNVQIYDTLKVVENFVNDIEIPTITAINGKGIHWEMAMMSDITLCTPDFVLQDDHFSMANGHIPGDGMTMCLQEVLGLKRGNYMSLMNKGLDAQKCLELGAVNEVIERENLLDRAWEIARYIMTRSRSCRRMTHHICVKRWREFVERYLRTMVISEMYSFNLSASSHKFDEIEYSDDKKI
ncbi:MAG: enoyl-CoA hydratase/isomerase family protein [Desulfobacteraceae bacterium]|nr:enoyl-CoA hydratase/isomerase family protein [Desulfobacteraceae bacterium]